MLSPRPSLLALLLATAFSSAWAADDLKPFPAAATGMQRHVIRLAAVAQPEDWRVEIIAGRQIETDCNRQRFGAHLSEQVLQGWGYSYYTISALQGPMGTLMACPPGSPHEARFVAAGFDHEALLRYNPRLPLVIYAPTDVEVKYRVWQAGEARKALRE